MIIESIREYFNNLESLSAFDDAININYLGAEIKNFSIEEAPTTPIIKQYTNGGSVRQFQFTFVSRGIYSQEILQNIENSNFYEMLCEEIENKNNKGRLPILENAEALSIDILSSPYIISNDENTAIYQISFRLKYFKE